MNASYNRKLYVSIIINEILLQRPRARCNLSACGKRCLNNKVEWERDLRIGGIYGNGKNVFWHNLSIIQSARSSEAQCIDVLKISHFF